MKRAAASLWAALAPGWDRSGPPLRPSRQDTEGYFRHAQEWMARNGTPRLLQLGVTPELQRLPWPPGHHLLAADSSLAMIRQVWPGDATQIVQTDWRELPLPDGSRDLVLGDAVLHQLPHPEGQQRLVDQLHRVLVPGGRCLLRVFIPPIMPESPEAVLAELRAGRIADLNQLKLRLDMAMQTSPREGVALDAVWQWLRQAVPDTENLARELGWPPGAFQGFAAYRGSKARYYYVSQAEAERLFCGTGKFVLRAAETFAYPLAERCPLLVFDRV